MKVKMIYLSILISFHPAYASLLKEPGEVMLAETYQINSGIALQSYWMSEKLDGIRGVWDGKDLKTRAGKLLSAPAWFYQLLPPFPVEGELWAGRGKFHLVQQTVLDQHPDSRAWRLISFVMFDIPFGTGGYQTRYLKLSQWLAGEKENSHIRLIEQYPVNSDKHLTEFMTQVIKQGGEGVMLKNKFAPYRSGRTQDLLKYKPYKDAEAVVLGYKMGQGKYKGMIGALLVRNRAGVEFYIGSGLNDQQRALPPRIGAWITYRYDRLTKYGKPRFPRFLREREESIPGKSAPVKKGAQEMLSNGSMTNG